ncbi:hypothetical protein [Streptomyces sp. NBRC 109706]|uniref:hypothetical protein n=1 Tax=Streptomyces sp. NBRC 109706 TaxID=1550035 RepID=UPI000785700F|nr:hypothetical protein [Streptomyces sp. NBRC 109706]
MTVAEFIVETQWTLLILLLATVLTVGMVCSEKFREAVLKRNWRAGVDGISSEVAAPASTTEAIEAVVNPAPDDSGTEDSVSYRKGAVENLVKEAAQWGWRQARAGSDEPPAPGIDWEADGGPRVYNLPEGKSLEDAAQSLASHLAAPAIREFQESPAMVELRESMRRALEGRSSRG